ncbi:MAG: hypothetical protein O7G32_12490, partial [SAR324 cluster bacterium]|nr:hypothetical protein [SAR324 cluster bacterium]
VDSLCCIGELKGISSRKLMYKIPTAAFPQARPLITFQSRLTLISMGVFVTEPDVIIIASSEYSCQANFR